MKADLIEKFRRAATQTEDKAHNLVRLRDNPNQLGSFSVDQFPEYESERVSIKISNIPPQTSSDNLKHLLDQQRVDHEGIIFGKYNQNQNKDYCFVKIMDKPHAEAAIRVLDGILFNDFVLRVEIARPPKRRD
ncbi:MAG: Serine arginine-rich splicing factor 2 [Marteilia pararefringens]